MHIQIHTESIRPMLEWLKARKAGNADEGALRRLFALPAYRTEFARYADPNLPVCTLSEEEVVDFFLHFDEKDFENPRLQMKKAPFLAFYADMDAMLEKTKWFLSLGEEDKKLMEKLLDAALPEDISRREAEFSVYLTISVGNSQGYPYGNSIVFDATNLDMFPDAQTVAMVLAHEIHHTFFGAFVPETLSPQALFAVNFAFEGLAIHFCNNGATKRKPAKYPEMQSLGVSDEDFLLYDADFEALFADFRSDYLRAAAMSEEEVCALISEKYEQFNYVCRSDRSVHPISQYPTYYLGCYLWGSVDLALGKQALFFLLAHPDAFRETYTLAAQKLGNGAYWL